MTAEGKVTEPHVFVSYSSKDRAVADAVLAALEGAGARCWIAPRDIRPGRDWGESIVEAIEGSRVMVLVFSGNANASPQVRREVERAVNKGVAIVPFRIENVAPCKSLEYFISVGHWLDAYAAPMAPHLARLRETVATLSRDGAIPPAERMVAAVGRAAKRHRAAAAAGAVVRVAGRSDLVKAGVALAVFAATATGVMWWRGGRWYWTTSTAAAAPADAPLGLGDGVAPPGDALDASAAESPDQPGRVRSAAGSAASPTEGVIPTPPPPPPPRPVLSTPPLRSVGEILRSAGAGEVTGLRLTSVAQIGPQRFCVIDGNTVREGGTVRGFAVQRIEADRVIVTRGGLRFELRPEPKPQAEPGGLLPPEVLFGPRGGGDARGGDGGGAGRRPPGR